MFSQSVSHILLVILAKKNVKAISQAINETLCYVRYGTSSHFIASSSTEKLTERNIIKYARFVLYMYVIYCAYCGYYFAISFCIRKTHILRCERPAYSTPDIFVPFYEMLYPAGKKYSRLSQGK